MDSSYNKSEINREKATELCLIDIRCRLAYASRLCGLDSTEIWEMVEDDLQHDITQTLRAIYG